MTSMSASGRVRPQTMGWKPCLCTPAREAAAERRGGPGMLRRWQSASVFGFGTKRSPIQIRPPRPAQKASDLHQAGLRPVLSNYRALAPGRRGRGKCKVQTTTTSCVSYAEDVMPGRRWSDLSEQTRRLLIAAAVADGALRVAALIDMKRRPPARSGARNGCGPRPSRSSTPPESCRSPTSPSGGAGSPDPTPRLQSGRSSRGCRGRFLTAPGMAGRGRILATGDAHAAAGVSGGCLQRTSRLRLLWLHRPGRTRESP